MDPKDLFVGGMAIVVGSLLLLAAAIGSNVPFQLPKLRWLEAKIGRGAARAVLAAIGTAVVAIGILIVVGWRPFAE